MKLWRTTFAFVICLFVPAHGEPQCSCVDGCGTNGTTFPGSGGNIVNVAYGKPANMSSVFTRDGKSGRACAAVNGRTGTVWILRDKDNTNCVHTTDNDYGASWLVDLGRTYTVTDITVYRRKGVNGAIRMSGMSVFVDNQLCYSFPNRTTANMAALNALPEQINITCLAPLTGRHVRFQKHGEDRGAGAYYINICEVQVWACKDGLYGAQCDQMCHCEDNDPCENYNGTCAKGCSTGFRGANCRCGHCRDGADCDVATLTCLSGCDQGWGTQFCNQSCPVGTHGYDCGERCGQCADSDTCNTVTGLCPKGCQAGWKGDNCKQECQSGSFGYNCSMLCNNCSRNRCNNVDGECLEGCKPGYQWTPENHFCNELCQNDRHGDNCSKPCGQCNGGVQCDPFTGTCTACVPQFQLPFCKVCTGNRYGASCELNCSTKCGGDGSCEQYTGQCVGGCKAGYRPGEKGFCNETCEEGKYGEECSQDCGNCNGACRHENGHCAAGCVDGFEGDLCARQVSSSGSNTPLIGGVAGGVVVLIALCAVLAFIIIRRKRRSRKRSSSETASPRRASNDQRLESGPSLVLNGQAGLQDETGGAVGTDAEESNFYEGLQTPDDSDRDPYSTPVFKGQQDKGRNSHTYQNPAWHASDTGHDYYNL